MSTSSKFGIVVETLVIMLIMRRLFTGQVVTGPPDTYLGGLGVGLRGLLESVRSGKAMLLVIPRRNNCPLAAGRSHLLIQCFPPILLLIDSEQTMATTFPLFPSLPFELRDQIWRSALPEPAGPTIYFYRGKDAGLRAY